jgi:nucleoside phosphorylase
MMDQTVDVGVVCALELETAAVVRRVGRAAKTIGSGFSVVSGIMGGRRAAIVRSDAGRAKLANATHALLTVHRPAWLIAAGFAIGLDLSLKRGELVVATELVNDQNATCVTQSIAQVAATIQPGVRAGRLLSISPLPRRRQDKQELASQFGAIAADQHSWSLATIAIEHDVPFLAVRVLVDDGSHDAEPESRAVFHPSGSYRLGGMVGAFMSGKGHVGKIWKIRSVAQRHADHLAQFLTRLIPILDIERGGKCNRSR